MRFSDVIGQDDAKEHLRRLVNGGRMPHALLFSGNAGVGQLPLAIATAQYICCERRSETDSCGECPSCVKFGKLSHPDLHFTFPIVKSAEKKVEVCDDMIELFRQYVSMNPYISVNAWFAGACGGKAGMIYAREGDEIIRKLSFKPYESSCKVMVIWAPELMKEECANHLLKFIEEPPENTLFFLATDDEERILGTIRSRCQRIALPPVDMQSLTRAASERFSLGGAEATLFARLASGSWGRLCEEVKRNDDETAYFELFKQMMRLAWTLDVREIKQWSEKMAAMGRDEQKQFLQTAQHEVRENFISHLGNPQLIYMNADEALFSAKFARFINERNVERIMSELELAENQIEQNVNSKIVFFHMMFSLYRLLKM